MIEYRDEGSIFDSGCQVLVNPVNCVGVMGAGLAAAFKAKFPANFNAYKTACDAKELKLHHMHLFHEVFTGVYIINFPTKGHWNDKSNIRDIAIGLKNLNLIIKACGFKSVAIPALGCGLGGLQWADVKSLISSYICNNIEVEVKVYEPK